MPPSPAPAPAPPPTASGAGPPRRPADRGGRAAPSRPAAAPPRTRAPRPPARRPVWRPPARAGRAPCPGCDRARRCAPVPPGTPGPVPPPCAARPPPRRAAVRPRTRAVPGRLLAPAPAAAQLAAVRHGQRPVAVPAAGRFPAALAGQPGNVPAARHLDEHRAAAQSLAQGLPGERRKPRGAGRRVPRLVRLADRAHLRGGLAHRLPVRRQRRGEARRHQLGRLHGVGVTAQQQACPLVGGAQQQDIAGVRLGRVVVRVRVVAVVPDRGEAQITDRREHRRPGADDPAHRAAADREPLAVPLLGPGVRGEQDMVARPQQCGELGVHPGGGPPVREDGQRAAPGCQRGGQGARQFAGPGGTRQRRPHRARRLAARQRRQEAGAARVAGPAPRLGRGGRGRCGR
ncbi:primosome assembly protein PriA [Streptomyces xiamenensis]|uniref:Primosome assembly protein PriA n=1 Tax=Streptomyces xiamenensis TaxID=408015 RepID=A0A0F7FQH4_9ACTN|nr:primosome assembly protein PriA [Streptomyces xiamenensis]